MSNVKYHYTAGSLGDLATHLRQLAHERREMGERAATDRANRIWKAEAEGLTIAAGVVEKTRIEPDGLTATIYARGDAAVGISDTHFELDLGSFRFDDASQRESFRLRLRAVFSDLLGEPAAIVFSDELGERP